MTVVVQSVAAVLVDARSLLDFHQPVSQGFCRGCHQYSRRVAWSPCPQATWAQGVVDSAVGASGSPR